MNQSVPSEILERIFLHLQPQDIMACSTVSKRWESILYNKKFWKWAQMTLSGSTNKTVFASKRLKIISSLSLEGHPKNSLKDIEGLDLLHLAPGFTYSEWEKEWIFRLILNTKKVYVQSLPRQELIEFFTWLSLHHRDKRHKLEDVNISGITLQELPGTLIGKGIRTCKRAAIKYCKINSEICDSMMKELNNTDNTSCLTEIDISGNCLYNLSQPKILAKLQSVNLRDSKLNTKTIELLLEEIHKCTDTPLSYLNISGNKLAYVQGRILIEGICKIKTVILVEGGDCALIHGPRSYQVMRIFTTIKTSKDIKLQNLSTWTYFKTNSTTIVNSKLRRLTLFFPGCKDRNTLPPIPDKIATEFLDGARSCRCFIYSMYDDKETTCFI